MLSFLFSAHLLNIGYKISSAQSRNVGGWKGKDKFYLDMKNFSWGEGFRKGPHKLIMRLRLLKKLSCERKSNED